MVHSHLSEFEVGERGDFSPLDFVTGCKLLPKICVASTDEAAAGCVVAPILLQVFERAGVTTRWVVELHLPINSSEPSHSSGDDKAWNDKQLSDNSLHEALWLQ